MSEMPSAEFPRPPVPRDAQSIDTKSYWDDYADAQLERLGDEPVIDPSLICGAFNSYLETGGADTDMEFQNSRLEERIVDLRQANDIHVGQVLEDIRSASDVLEANPNLSDRHRRILPRFIEGMQRRALQLWTEPSPTIQH